MYLGVAQACSQRVVAWLSSSTDRSLSYFCLGATTILVPETFKLKNFEKWLPATYKNGRVGNATLDSCKYLYNETHIRITQASINKTSCIDKGIGKTWLTVDMIRKIVRESMLLAMGCITSYESLWILVQPKDLDIYFSQQWKFITWCV